MKFFFALARFGLLVTTIWMLAMCQQCQGARSDFGLIGTYFLPILGLIYAIFANAAGIVKDWEKGSEHTQVILTEWYYGAIALTTLGGVLILGAKYFIAGSACNQCLAFWLCHLVLFWELLQSKTRISMMTAPATIVAALLLTVTARSTDAESYIIRNLSLIGIAKRAPSTGLYPGSKAPAMPGLSAKSYKLILWTDCPVCLRSSLPQIVKGIGEYSEVYVATLSSSNAKDITTQIPRARIIEADQAKFEEWNVGTTAAPRGFDVINGTISANVGGEKR